MSPAVCGDEFRQGEGATGSCSSSGAAVQPAGEIEFVAGATGALLGSGLRQQDGHLSVAAKCSVDRAQRQQPMASYAIA